MGCINFKGRLKALLKGSKQKDAGGPEQGSGTPSLASTAADPDSRSEPTSGPARAPRGPVIAAQSPPEQALPAPASPPQPAGSDTTSPTPNGDLWAQAYAMLQTREPELAKDYWQHLASRQGGEEDNSQVDELHLSTPRSVNSIVKQLSDRRDKEQLRVPLLGMNIKVREQAEKLVKFFLWADPAI